MKNKISAFLFLMILLNCFQGISQISNYSKTITFNSITIPAGSCYIDHDDGNGWNGALEDPTIVVRCNSANGTVLFSKTWSALISSSGTYNLMFPAFACSPAGNSFVIDPVNILLVSSINLYVLTFERENSSCDNPNNQDCLGQGMRNFNLNVGSYSINMGDIIYNYTVTQAPSAASGTFCGLALPIELSSFEVIQMGNFAELLWKTSSERNNDFFTIERSINGLDWEERHRIDGAGNSNTELSYRLLDENTILGTTYYRLKQTDFDGVFTYSDILSYRFSNENYNQLLVYPNPSSTDLIQVFGNNLQNESLKIHDLYGHDLTNQIVITNAESGLILNISSIKPGYYFLTSDSSTAKFLKL